MAAATHESHALPVLLAGRSPSPFLLEGKSRGRSPTSRPLPHSRQLLSPPLLGHRSHHSVSAVIGTPSAPTRDEPSLAEDVQAETDVQEHHALTQAKTGCQQPMELPASGSNSRLRKDLPARARKLCLWELFLIASLFFLSFTFETIAAVHARLEQSSKEYVMDTGMFDYTSPGEWRLLMRSGLASRYERQRVEAESQSLTGSPQHFRTTACFFADIGILSRTLVVPIGLGPWRDQLASRLRCTNLPQALQKHLASASWRLHGKRIFEPPAKDLVDQVLRLDVPGLLGGMPASGQSIFRNMRLPETGGVIDLDSDLEPQATSASVPEHGSLPGAAALEVSQTLSGTSNVAATEANQRKFKIPVKSNHKRKLIDLVDREHRREREAKRRQKSSVKAKDAERKKTAASKAKAKALRQTEKSKKADRIAHQTAAYKEGHAERMRTARLDAKEAAAKNVQDL